MKIITQLLVPLFLLPVYWIPWQSVGVGSKQNSADPVMVAADFKDLNCQSRGRNLCGVSLLAEGASVPPEADFTAKLSVNEQGRMTLEVPKTSVFSQDASEAFAQPTYELPADFNLPAEVANALQLPVEAAVLRAGSYPVQDMETHYLILF